MLDYNCVACGEAMSSPESMIGKKELCPKCGKSIIVASTKTLNKKTTPSSHEFKIKVCKAKIDNIKTHFTGQGKMTLYTDTWGNKMIHVIFAVPFNWFLALCLAFVILLITRFIAQAIVDSGIVTFLIIPGWLIYYFLLRSFLSKNYEFVNQLTKETCLIAPNKKMCFFKMNDDAWIATPSNAERSNIVSLYIQD
ncbi:MAG TPA: hypothetical protein PLK08_01155 [Phycisphaerae bacterium]|nr:hypothetical protein [Phycisphaerae bacterium]